MKLFSIILSMVLCSTVLQAKVINCQNPQAAGVPVVQFNIENNSVVEASEILQSNLTGILKNSKKLSRILSYNKNIFLFHLGSNYTVDYTLVVNVENIPITASIKALDRDDWNESSTDLANCN